MNSYTPNNAFLVLADGTVFHGIAFGYIGMVSGEVVFNTGMTGYQEVITDPSYYGQLIAFTYPEIGNTGVNDFDQESAGPSVKGLITRCLSPVASNWRSQRSFETWLKENKVVGIKSLDTRSLVRRIRDMGSMNGIISSDKTFTPTQLLNKLKEAPEMKGLNLAEKVSTKTTYIYKSSTSPSFDQRIKNKNTVPFKVTAIDFGVKKSILERLIAHGCEVRVIPASSTITDVLHGSPEGIFLSNGPGDPSALDQSIRLVKDLIAKSNLPIFGICLGHQILGLALGGKTYKLPFGHRGLNHPCGKSGQLEITSQNHGFALDVETLPKGTVNVTHLNLNDKTVAGISLKEKPIFGIQYHPEASPGPHDADHHFARFTSFMQENRISVV